MSRVLSSDEIVRPLEMIKFVYQHRYKKRGYKSKEIKDTIYTQVKLYCSQHDIELRVQTESFTRGTRYLWVDIEKDGRKARVTSLSEVIPKCKELDWN